MQILDIKQGSNEWFEMRSKYITSTDIPIIMRTNKRKSLATLWRQKKGLEPWEEANEKMLEGKFLEKEALKLYNDKYNTNFEPVCVINSKYPWMFTSLDGYDKNRKEILEIKSGEATYDKAIEGHIAAYYIDQGQHHICVSESKFCHYLAYRPDKTPIELFIGINESRIEEIKQKSKEFYDMLLNNICPEEDFLERTEKDANEQATKWSLVKTKAEEYLKKEKEERLKLFDFTDDGNCIFPEANVKVQRITKPGVFDYERLLKDFNITEDILERYRKSEISYLQAVRMKVREG